MRTDIYTRNQAHIERDPLTKYHDRYAENTSRKYEQGSLEFETPDIDIFTEQE